MGIGFKWTKEAEEFLVNNWNKMTLYRLAGELHTIPETLPEKAQELGLGDYKSNRWTQEEIEKLRELAPTIFYKDIAHILGKGTLAVYKKAEKLGIKLIVDPVIWTDEQIKYLLENYDKVGITELGDTISMSYRRIVAKLKELGIEWQTKLWTEEEIKVLREMAQTCHYSEIAKVLNRSVGAISAKAFYLGIETISEYRKFTEEEQQFVINNWEAMNTSDIARTLKCSYGVINGLAKKLDLPLKGQNIKWTDKNINLLEQLAKTKSVSQLAKKFKTTNTAIISIAHKSGIKLIDSKQQWTDELNNKLIELSKTMTVNQLSQEFQVPSYSIKKQASRLGISLINNDTRKTKNWTREEVEQLTTLLSTHTTLEIATIMNRTEDAIYVKAKKLGLEVKTQRKRWTKQDEDDLKDMWGTYSLEYIAKKLNRTPSAITNKLFLLGLGSAIENNYDGLTIQEICDLFGKKRNTIAIDWVALGLSFQTKKISNNRSYSIVPIADLFEFLERNQGIWDSRNLEVNILGKEPEWLEQKRKIDRTLPEETFMRNAITKEQLIAAKRYYLELAEQEEIEETPLRDGPQLRLRRMQNGKKDINN